jgi:hypothetical protein
MFSFTASYSKLLIIFLCISIVACKQVDKNKSTINVEMVGAWANSSGCEAHFTKLNNKLFLTKFTNKNNYTLSNIHLKSQKVSIMTTFKAENPTINFSGNFLEGVIIINNYCSQPLHKITN